MEPMNYMEHKEIFDVVCIKEGTSELSAKPADFKRVRIEASSPLSAMLAVNEKGFRAMFATKPDMLTEPEVMARRREMDDTTDRSKI